MDITEKFSRFRRKAPGEQWAAVKATAAEILGLRRGAAFSRDVGHAWRRAVVQLRVAFMHAKAERIEFLSGVGDSVNVLYGLARSMKPDVCVEIGSARGRSACFIGMALKENGRGMLYAIDPHKATAWNDHMSVETYDILRSNVMALGLTDHVTILRSTSDDAARGWNRPIDLIFIDGDHSYEGVKRDWDLFSPHVKPFGLVVFHDTFWEIKGRPEWMRQGMGVPRFVDELREQGFQVLTIDQDYGVSVVQPTVGGRPLRIAAGSQQPAHSISQ